MGAGYICTWRQELAARIGGGFPNPPWGEHPIVAVDVPHKTLELEEIKATRKSQQSLTKITGRTCARYLWTQG